MIHLQVDIANLVAAIALFWAAGKVWKRSNRDKLSFGIYLSIVLLSLVLYVTRIWVVPGGPFVSIHGEVVPIYGCVTVMIAAVRAVRRASILGRIGLYFTAATVASISGFMIGNVVSFWRDNYPRGTILGW
jgi:hypothetical protein